MQLTKQNPAVHGGSIKKKNNKSEMQKLSGDFKNLGYAASKMANTITLPPLHGQKRAAEIVLDPFTLAAHGIVKICGITYDDAGKREIQMFHFQVVPLKNDVAKKKGGKK